MTVLDFLALLKFSVTKDLTYFYNLGTKYSRNLRNV